MKLRRILICLLALLTATFGLASVVAEAQSSAGANAAKRSYNAEAFVIYVNASGEVTCRVASVVERRRIMQREGKTQVIYEGAPRRKTGAGEEDFSPAAASNSALPALQPSAGLRIVLHGTSQLNDTTNADAVAAKNAFIVAANRWEALISTPITVVLDVDYGPNFFGKPYPDPNILGQTGTSRISTTLSNIRARLLNNSPTAAEQSLYNALPPSVVPVELNGVTSNVQSVRLALPNARALGIVSDITNPDSLPIDSGDAGIGFNSAFQFDFNPDDGISPGKTDFDSVVTHEIGHALGFISESGGGNSQPLSLWDLFRFRPGVTLGSSTSAARVMSSGGSQVFFYNQTNTFGSQELELSTGGPTGDATGGDGNQSSHWKADEQSGRYIGIMDPTLRAGVRKTITDNDVKAIDSFGYAIGGTAPPPPTPDPAPANDNFVNAVVLQGSTGTVTGTNVSATKEAGEPSIAGNPGGRSVWYFWTAPGTGTATFETVGSDYDTLLGIFNGGAVGALAPACAACENDDINTDGGVFTSRVTFNAQAGVTYRIAVDGFNEQTGADAGNIVLHWTAAAATPTPTPTPSFSVSGRVVDPQGNGVQGVSLAIDGPNLVNGFPALPTTTDAAGNYQFSQLTPNGSYTVRSNDSRFVFSPPSASFNFISANHTGINFTVTPSATTVTGRIIDQSNQGLAGVIVGFYGQNGVLLQQMTTGTDGRWTFNCSIGQAYSTFFVKSGYTFNPPGLTFPVNGANQNMGDVPATKGNSIDATDFYVTKQYEDFLGRSPDQSGLNFWMQNIESCGLDLQCRAVKRIDTSAAFFLSIEFQQTGYLVERMYKAAYGDATGTSTFPNLRQLAVPVIRRAEFLADTAIIRNGLIVGQTGWEQVLENNKNTFALAFVQRQRFTDAYPATMTPAAFVAKLNQNTGGALTQTEVDLIAADFGGAADTSDVSKRAGVLRKVAENREVDRREKNRAFVLMQYFGYLQRDPNAGPDSDYTGWSFWLSKLDEFGGDFRRAEMVKAFISSSEYRGRFGQP